jgi:hypothetical protein
MEVAAGLASVLDPATNRLHFPSIFFPVHLSHLSGLIQISSSTAAHVSCAHIDDPAAQIVRQLRRSSLSPLRNA